MLKVKAFVSIKQALMKGQVGNIWSRGRSDGLTGPQSKNEVVFSQ